MLPKVISALETELHAAQKSALENPPDTNHAYYFGVQVGINRGLQRALDLVNDLIAGDEKDGDTTLR